MKSRTKTIVLFLGLSLCFCHGAENLIKNGETSSGEAPIIGLELTASGPHGVRCYAVPQARKMYMGPDFIKVDPNVEYEFSAEICGNGKDANRAAIGLVMYDEKKGLIPHSTVDCVPGSEAVTAEPVAKGAKVMLLKNAGDWETFVKRGARIIAMNAKKDFLDLPNRDLCCFIQKITRKGDLLEVTLSIGAGKAYPANTPVRLHRDGGYQWSLFEFQVVPNAWKKVSVRILGTAIRGVPKNQFWKTTRYVKPVINSNMDSALFIRNLSLTKVESIPEGKVK